MQDSDRIRLVQTLATLRDGNFVEDFPIFMISIIIMIV